MMLLKLNGKTHCLLGSRPPTVLQPVGDWVVAGGCVGVGGVGGGGGGGVGPVAGGGGLPDSLGHPSSEPVCDLTQSRTSG